jgi:4-hydroxy-tetrahydrodipicolinate reductase
MSTIKVMVNGLPGNVTQMIASHIARDEALTLLPYSLTGPEIDIDRIAIENIDIELIRPDRRDASIMSIKDNYDSFISVDFTHPSAVNRNARFYCTHGLPFVMGTTGGDRQDLHETVTKSSVSAVIAPNMARQIVGLQAMLAYGAENFPGLFQGYTLTVHESHQQGKADTSGTAKAMVGYFNAMGVDFANDQIQKERDPAIQKQEWGVPEAYLDGHGWHTYTLTSPDGTAMFELKHNINGREIYVEGTLKAVDYLNRKVQGGSHGRIYSMVDVLKKD